MILSSERRPSTRRQVRGLNPHDTQHSTVSVNRPPGAVTQRDQRLFALGSVLLAFGAILGLIEPVAALLRRVPRNYNEGWNAFWADAALHGRSLYDPANDLISNNYPPVSFHVVGWAGHWLGDNVIAGRLIALASLFVVTVCVALWLRAAGADRKASLAGALFCLFVFTSFGADYVAMNDPQMLAHAFMMVGLVALWRGAFDHAVVATCALLLLLGGFTKHLLIPLPAAVTLWLLLYHRRQLATWVVCSAAGLLLAFVLVSAVDGSEFLWALSSPREYSLYTAFRATLTISGKFAVVLALAVFSIVTVLRAERGRERIVLSESARFVLLYLALALAIGAAAAGGAGVVRNAFFDLFIAASLGIGLGVAFLVGPSRDHYGRRLAARVVLFLGMAASLRAAVNLPDTLRNIGRLDETERETVAIVRLIAELGDGRAACETLQLCYWAQNAFVMDFFNYGQKLTTGVLPLASCTEALRRGDFPVLQIDATEDLSVPRLSACGPAIERYYSVVFRSTVGTLLVPKYGP